MTATCDACLLPPAALPETGRLLVAAPLAHSRARLAAALSAAGVAAGDGPGGILEIPLGEGVLARVAAASSGLSRLEREDTRALVLPHHDAPGPSDLLGSQSLARLSARVGATWLAQMLAGERLRTEFQPIVHADAPERVFAWECLLRGEGGDGATVAPSLLFSTAREAGLLFALDRAARVRAIRAAAAAGIEAGVFINFTPNSVYDPAFCLRTTVAAAREAGLAPAQIVFEVTETEEVSDPDHLLRILDHYRASGFRVALDDLGSGYSSLDLLNRLRPDFVKLDHQLLAGVDQDPFKARVCAGLLDLTRRLGVRSVVEGIETEAEWAWAREHGADLAQGYLFGRPHPEPRGSSLPSTFQGER